jgi:UDP-N-acetylmuramate dehydrogenase
MSWCSGLEGICRAQVPLAEYTWYRLGGPARWFVTPRDVDELAEVLARLHAHEVPWRILGRGANVIVRDEGVDAAVLHLTGPWWEHVELDPPSVTARGGVDSTRLVRQTVDAGLAGLENLAGIPGSVGGLVRMNAGGKYGQIASYVASVDLLQPDGTRQTRTAAELDFAYRHCNIGNAIVTAATFTLTPADPGPLRERYRRIWQEKSAEQPAVSAKTAGCIFKNPPGHAAGKLIDDAGLKGTRRGQAEISTRHANFICAYPGATAQDVVDLATLARDRVERETGITLEFEVDIW